MNLSGAQLGITGVGGFIGLALARRLRELGAAVRGLERGEEAAARARAAGVDVVQGDVTRAQDCARFAHGCQAVIHTAARVDEGRDLEAFRAVNVQGTVKVAEAAREAGAERLVHFSSVMVHGFTFPPDVDEDGPLRGEGNPYCLTKVESEAALRPLHQPGRFGVSIVRPGDVYGPGSVPWVVRPVTLMKQGLFVLPSDAGVLNPVYIDTLVDGVVRVLERDADGTFALTEGFSVPCRDYFGRLAAMVGTTVRVLPAGLLRGAFGALEVVCDAVGVTPPARAEALRFLQRPHTYSGRKAREVLGLTPLVGLDEGLRRTRAWLEEEGLL